MRLEHLYTLRVSYRELWAEGDQRYGVMEGPCEGLITGRFVGANHARVRGDGGYLPDLQGFITTDDGAKVLFDLKGRGVIGGDADFHAVNAVTHIASDERYARLNDVVCAGEATQSGDEPIELEVYELVWEEMAE